MALAFLFGRQKTPRGILREHQRAINNAIRSVDRQRCDLQTEEKNNMTEIKKAAKCGQMETAKILAKNLMRTRNYVKKCFKMEAQLKAVNLNIQSMRTIQEMGTAIRGVTKVMIKMNKQMNLPLMQRITTEFVHQTDTLNIKDELINDTMDDMMAESDDDEVSDDILNQVLDEIGIELTKNLVDTPATIPENKIDKERDIDSALQARLDKLKR